jgi:hypothetical protein
VRSRALDLSGLGDVAAGRLLLLASMMKDASWEILDVEIDDDVEVQQLADDVAVLAYKVHENLTVDSVLVSLDAADASTWVRRDGGCVCALHTESIAGDPFGRDRVAA